MHRSTAPLTLIATLLAAILAACATTPGPDLAPAAPTGLVADRLDGALAVSWDANDEPDLARYTLSIVVSPTARSAALEPIPDIPAGTESATVEGLDNASSYTLSLAAVDRAGNASEPTTLKARPGDDNEPAPPTGVGVTAGDTEVTIVWDPSPEGDIAEYEVLQDPLSASPSKVGVVPVGSESWTVSGLDNGTTYAFAVRAVDTSGNRSAESAVVEVAPVDLSVPGFPTGIGVIAGDGEAFLSWDPSPETDIDRYDIFQGTVSGSLSKVAEVPVGTESYQATPLVNGTTYLFAVSAIDDSDNASPLSVEVSATPAPIVVLARATGQITSQFSTIRLWRGADPVEAASLTLNGTDYTDSGGGTYKVTLPAFMVPGDPIDLDIAIGAESIEGTETFPPDVTVSSPADGASYSAGVDVDVAWTVAEEPDAFFLQVTCTGGACSHPADTLEIDLAGDLTSYTIPSGDLVTNGVYTLRLDAINLVDLTGDFHIDSSIPVINTLPGPSSPTIQVVP